jgi:hypothetical protein
METKTMAGKVGSCAEPYPGLFNFELLVAGNQYPTRMSTNDAAIVAQGKEAQHWGSALIEYTESEGKINPKSGKPYINRDIVAIRQDDGSSVAPVASSNGSPAKAGGGGYWKPRDPAESRSIVRQVAAKSAFEFVGLMKPSKVTLTDATVMALSVAEMIEDWVYREELSLADQSKAAFEAADDVAGLLKAIDAAGEKWESFDNVQQFLDVVQCVSTHGHKYTPDEWADVLKRRQFYIDVANKPTGPAPSVDAQAEAVF